MIGIYISLLSVFIDTIAYFSVIILHGMTVEQTHLFTRPSCLLFGITSACLFSGASPGFLVLLNASVNCLDF